MKTVFFLLLLANVGYFAWTYLGERRVFGEAQLAEQQVDQQGIRLLSAEQVVALVAERPKSDAEPARPPSKATVVACLEFGAFGPAEVSRVQKALEPLALGSRLSQRREGEIASYWVYMPPQRSRQAANQKASELKKLGVVDFFVLQEDSKLRYAISLGVFKTEEAAQARLEELRRKGVRTARVGPRETSVQKVYFAVRDVPEALASRLEELRRDFAGSELKACPPGEKR
ncbi:MAG: SPOR domain-containing protein [Burkholderiales bacterium]